jgi:LiaI-LiaF-like transmembrane region
MTATFCRSCGNRLTEEEQAIPGNVLCSACAPPQAATQAPDPAWSAPAASGPSPGLAFILGLIPGVGAIYNGQYAKGLVHVLILGLLSTAVDMDGGQTETLWRFLLVGFWFYMPFEAYHTAQKRLRGEPVDEFSSLLPRKGPGFIAAPVALIVMGLVFLLNNLGVLRLEQIARYWPVVLIALGLYLLYVRITQPAPADRPSDNRREEAPREQ